MDQANIFFDEENHKLVRGMWFMDGNALVVTDSEQEAWLHRETDLHDSQSQLHTEGTESSCLQDQTIQLFNVIVTIILLQSFALAEPSSNSLMYGRPNDA